MSKPRINYHHVVIVAKDQKAACKNFGKRFHFDPPACNAMKDAMDFLTPFLRTSTCRGQAWTPDFKQAVFNQRSRFFEIDEPGAADCFRDFVEKHGNGIIYLGIVEGENRNPFVKRLNEEFHCETLVEQVLVGDGWNGDWLVLDTERLLGCNLCVKSVPGGDHTDNPKMDDFSQIAILVPDLDEAVRNWKSIFQFDTLDMVTETGDICYQGNTEQISYRRFTVDSGVFPIYVMEAPKNTVLDVIRKHIGGNGILHVGVSGKNEDELDDAQVLVTYPCDGKIVTVYDTQSELGTYVSVAR